ncbi:MAG: plasmid recombination protein, partial [Clostridia bacterium]|nr:plasmid recombination protein [Clostridia bacterium]
ALEFLKREVGERNIFSAVVHMDERNPHMHLCFVPLTEDNRLSAKEVIGSRDKLVQWQDRFHDHMAALFPALERGESAAVTKRKHIPTWLFKQAHRLSREMTEIREELENINAWNAGRQRDKVLKRLEAWLPRVNAFEAQLRPYEEQFKINRQNESILRQNEQRAEAALQRERVANQSLTTELRKYRAFLSAIPPEMIEEIRERFREEQLKQQRQQHEMK